MAKLMLMPKLSDTMDEGIILKWRKKEGEAIKQGDILADIQSDKADMEQEAYDSGIVRKLFAKEGEGVKVGTPLAIIGTADEDIAGLLTGGGAKQPAQTEAQAGGEQKVETPKGVPPITSSHLAATTLEPTTTAAAPTSQPAGSVQAAQGTQQALQGAAQQQQSTDETGRMKISPLARKLADEKNIDLSQLQGSGPGGRIIKRDIEQYAPAAQTASAPAPRPAPIAQGETKEIPLSLMRKTIAKRLVESKVTAPHFYLTVEADMKPATDFRTMLNETGEVKISFNDLIVKASALALRKHPEVNATFTPEKILQYGSVHVGVAVAIDDGLITPVIRNADLKGLAGISAETKELAGRAREKKLKPEEFTGGTFTVSNLGMFDVENFAAIINPPEGAILAIGSILEKPVVENGAIVVGSRMKMTLSCDHRVVDGAVGARFMQTLKKYLEHPAMLAL
ncbi:MAG TPA: pyruvate dehydrogenase complex dihydrolipoamide acetyltransferase [Bacteroidota bacterium]|nr:pyruvate dehydrogenase complex dihydrolipoamide acetyltransferase [Bacteroidota bacterium]